MTDAGMDVMAVFACDANMVGVTSGHVIPGLYKQASNLMEYILQSLLSALQFAIVLVRTASESLASMGVSTEVRLWSTFIY